MMHIGPGTLLLLVPLVATQGYVGDALRPGVRRVVRGLGVVLLVIGAGGFFGQGCAASGALGQMRHVAWPVGTTTDAVQMADGRYAVPLEHLGRVQIYDRELRFQDGWQWKGKSKLFVLRAGKDDTLEIYASQGRTYEFRPDGTPVSSGTYDSRTGPPSAARRATLTISWAWWQFPFLSPAYSWGILAPGMLMIILTTTRQEREKQQRRAAERAARPKGAMATGAIEGLRWLGAALWAGVGVAWFIAALGMLIKCIATGNVLGTVVAVPFLLIGCFLLFIAITIVRVAVMGVVRWIGEWGR